MSLCDFLNLHWTSFYNNWLEIKQKISIHEVLILQKNTTSGLTKIKSVYQFIVYVISVTVIEQKLQANEWNIGHCNLLWTQLDNNN